MEWNELVLKHIPDDHVKLMVSMMYTTYRYEKVMASVFKPFNLSYEQFCVLILLEAIYPEHYSLKEVQERLINQTANATRLVEKLRKKGLVTSVQNTENRRQLKISLTDEGLQLAKESKDALNAFTNQFKPIVTNEEVRDGLDLFSRMQEVISQ